MVETTQGRDNSRSRQLRVKDNLESKIGELIHENYFSKVVSAVQHTQNFALLLQAPSICKPYEQLCVSRTHTVYF